MIDAARPPGAMKGIFWTQWTYWWALAVAAWSYSHMPPGSVRIILLLTPVLPALLIASMAYWVYRDCDEYIQAQIRRSVVVTALTVAFGTLGCFIAELFGAASVSAVWVNVAGWSLFNLQMLYILFRSR